MTDKGEAIAIYNDSPVSPLPMYLEFGTRHFSRDRDLLNAATRVSGAVLLETTLGSAMANEPGVETMLELQRDDIRSMLYVEMKGRPSPQTFKDTIPIGKRLAYLAEREVTPDAVCLHWESTPEFPEPPSADAMDSICFASRSAFPDAPVIAYGYNEFRVGPNGTGINGSYPYPLKVDAQTITLYNEEPAANDFILGEMRNIYRSARPPKDLYAWTSFGFSRCYESGGDSRWGFDKHAMRGLASEHYQGKRLKYWSVQDHGGIKLVGVVPFKGLQSGQLQIRNATVLRTMIRGMRGEGLRSD